MSLPDPGSERSSEKDVEKTPETSGSGSYLPPPNIQDGDGSATYGNETSVARRTRDWGVAYRHPLDSYAPPPRSRGWNSIGGALFAGIGIVLLCVLLIGLALGWATTGRFVAKGYEVVRLTEAEAVVRTSPGKPTCYLGRKIELRIPKCSQPIAVVAREVSLGGDFLADVDLMAFRIHATKVSRFARDLEIYAFEFRDESETLLGEITGLAIQETGPEKPPPDTP